MLVATSIVCCLLLQVAGMLAIPLGLPGLWLQVLGAVGVAQLAGMSWYWSAAVVALACVGEGIEFLSGRWGAQRFGGSSAAAWGALLGGIVGAIVGGIPVPVVGSVIASFIGTFLGALGGEMWSQRRAAPKLRVGFGAVLGRVVGVAAKLSIAFAIFIGSLVALVVAA